MMSLMGFVGKFWASVCPENESRVVKVSSASEPKVVRRSFEFMLFPLMCLPKIYLIDKSEMED